MGIRSGVCTFALAVVLVISLGGCVQQDPVVMPVPTPTSTPVFASDEEALAAAVEALGRYLDMWNSVRADGGRKAERMSDVVTPSQYARELDGIREFARTGNSTVGNVTARDVELQQVIEDGDSAEVVVYACLDATTVTVVDQHGSEVVRKDPPGRQVFEMSFQGTALRLLLSGTELWQGHSC